MSKFTETPKTDEKPLSHKEYELILMCWRCGASAYLLGAGWELCVAALHDRGYSVAKVRSTAREAFHNGYRAAEVGQVLFTEASYRSCGKQAPPKPQPNPYIQRLLLGE